MKLSKKKRDDRGSAKTNLFITVLRFKLEDLEDLSSLSELTNSIFPIGHPAYQVRSHFLYEKVYNALDAFMKHRGIERWFEHKGKCRRAKDEDKHKRFYYKLGEADGPGYFDHIFELKDRAQIFVDMKHLVLQRFRSFTGEYQNVPLETECRLHKLVHGMAIIATAEWERFRDGRGRLWKEVSDLERFELYRLCTLLGITAHRDVWGKVDESVLVGPLPERMNIMIEAPETVEKAVEEEPENAPVSVAPQQEEGEILAESGDKTPDNSLAESPGKLEAKPVINPQPDVVTKGELLAAVEAIVSAIKPQEGEDREEERSEAAPVPVDEAPDPVSGAEELEMKSVPAKSQPVEIPAFDLDELWQEAEPQISKVEKEEAPVSSEVEEPVEDVEEAAELVEMVRNPAPSWVTAVAAAAVLIVVVWTGVNGKPGPVEAEAERIVARADFYTAPVMPDLGEPEEENRLVEKVEPEPVLEGAELAKAMVDEGFSLILNGQSGKALKKLDMAQGVEGIQPVIYARSVGYMGRALTMLGRLEEAALKHAEAYHLLKRIPGTYGSRMLAKSDEARTYYLLKDFDRAERELVAGNDQKVTDPDIKFQWFAVKIRIDTALGRYEDVLKSTELLLEFQVGRAYESEAMSWMSFAHVINGNLQEAHYYQSQSKAMRGPDEPEIYDMYGTVSDIIYANLIKMDSSRMVKKVEDYLSRSPDAELEQLLEFARDFKGAIY